MCNFGAFFDELEALMMPILALACDGKLARDKSETNFE